MAVNKRKVLDAARKYAQKGAKEKALKEYHVLLKLDPRDAKLHLEIGDCYRRWGQIDEAITQYTRVAEQYKQDGFDARAVAVFKQILNLDPKGYGSYVSLSELYQRMGLDAEALGALQAAADGYHREGNKREALELLRKMATLDPTNTTSRLKVAELLRQEGMEVDAVAEYEAAVAELERQGASESTLTIRERILELCPERNDVRLGIARQLVALRKPERAEPFARKAVDCDPEDSDAYELLCDIYKGLGNDQELAKITRRLAKIYRDRGDQDKARELAQRVPLGLEFEADGSESAGVDETDSSFLSDDELLDDDFLAADDSEERDVSEELPLAEADELEFELDDEAEPEELLLDDGLDEDDQELTEDDDSVAAPKPEGDPEQLLAEASVYLRYGKRDEAIASLQVVLDQEPEHRAALEKLGDVYAENEEADKAVAMWSRAALCARADIDEEGFAVLRDRIAALDADAAEALGDASTDDVSALIASEVDAALDFEVDPGEPDNDDSAFDIDVSVGDDESQHGIEIDLSDDDEAGDVEESIEVDVEVDFDDDEAAASQSLGSSTTTSQQVAEDLEEADFYFQQKLFDESEAIYRRILEIAPNHASALLRLGELAAAKGNDPARVGSVAGAPQDTQLEGRAPGEDSTEVAELFLDGDEEEEPAVKLDLPPAPAAKSKSVRPVSQAEDTVPIDPSEVEEPAQEAEEEDGGFDLAAELRGVLDDDDDSAPEFAAGRLSTVDDGFESIFADFKQGVSATLSGDDYETRYDLGIAYREMELYEDAIGEFRMCLDSPNRKLASLHLMGLCALDLGRATDAVNHLEQAMAMEELPAEQLTGLRFDLGRAHEAAGDLVRARSAYEAVVEAEPNFPGVAERLEMLPKADASDAPVELEDESEDGGFESFEDLVAEAQADDDVVEETESFESFDDFITEADAIVAEPLVEVEAVAETVAEPEPSNDWGGWTSPNGSPTWKQGDPDPSEAEAEPKSKKKRKKKISFV